MSAAPAIHHAVRGAIGSGRVGAITGAASGIGLAAAHAYAKLDMKLALCDVDLAALERAAKPLQAQLGQANVLLSKVDVAEMAQLEAFRDKVLDAFGEVNVLMLNAGISTDNGKTFGRNLDQWHKTLDVNLFGVINGTQAFVPFMVNQENPSVVVVTGSKQGITCPPGNAAYNVSKAAVKALTEQLAHELREAHSGCSAHLFVPGWTFTGMTSGGDMTKNKPDGAWTADETVGYMLEKLDDGQFYIICPDNETSEDLDKLRISWSASDPIFRRPALSRWHPEFKGAFDEFVREGLRGGRESRSSSRPRGRVGELGGEGEKVKREESRGSRTPAES